MTYIKPDPEMQEEQEDLIMSYLNADYLSTDTPLSPPSSTSSSSETTGSPEKHAVDDFMLDINTADFLNNDGQHPWTTNSDIFNPCLPQQHQPDLLSAFPFFLPTTLDATQFIQPLPSTINANTAMTTSFTASPPPPPPPSSASSSDAEQPKKKRGRKKREPVVHSTCAAQPSLLAPKPLAPRPETQIKQEPMAVDISPSQLAGPTVAQDETALKIEPQRTPEPLQSQPNYTSQEAQKQAQIQKRQERLIKNRAAALLSRKRKREHLTLLEEEKQHLVTENERLTHKVDTLESRIQSLENENMELKARLEQQSAGNSNTVIHIGNSNKRIAHHSAQKPSKATGVVFMIILFSFALFTLPSRAADRLTVGGSSVLAENKKQFPLIGSASTDDYAVEQYCQQGDYCDEAMVDANTNTTDLVLIDSVRPRDLQTWINHKLDVSMDDNKKLVSWFPTTSNSNSNSNSDSSNSSHVYLYSKEFSQLASIHPPHQQEGSDRSPPTISLVSPYNQTATEVDSYLQIDVQVLRSQVIKGQLMSLQQYGSASTALLDGMKKDLLNSNVTRSNNKKEDFVVKREKRTKKLSRVII